MFEQGKGFVNVFCKFAASSLCRSSIERKGKKGPGIGKSHCLE